MSFETYKTQHCVIMLNAWVVHDIAIVYHNSVCMLFIKSLSRSTCFTEKEQL